MARKKKKRICAHCGETITRVIKRVEKGAPIFCSINHGISYYSSGNKKKKPKKKKSDKQLTKLMAVKDVKRTNPNWFNDPLFVYIGNKVQFYPMRQSIFHNPYRTQKLGRRKAIDKFERQFYRKLQSDSSFKEAVEGLRGKILVCWCSSFSSVSCHGDVIINYLHKPKTLEDYKEKVEKVPQDIDTTKTDLIFNLIRLYEVQQDQFTYKDRLDRIEGVNCRYITFDILATQSGYPIELVRGCLLSLNVLTNKVYWNGGIYIESKDHYIQRNHIDYKGAVKINKRNQMKIYDLFGGRPQEFIDKEIIRSR